MYLRYFLLWNTHLKAVVNTVQSIISKEITDAELSKNKTLGSKIIHVHLLLRKACLLY